MEQPVSIFGECGRVPKGIVGIGTNKPAKRHVVVQLFQQLPLGPNAVDRLQLQRLQQLIGWNRGASTLGVTLGKRGVEPVQGLIGQAPHLPQGMAGRDSVFCGGLREQGTCAFLLAEHPLSAVDPLSRSGWGFSAAS